MLGLVVAGCGAESFDPCTSSETLDVVGPDSAETWGATVLVVDDLGYALFWVHETSAEGGVWATRPGGAHVRLASAELQQQSLSVVPVSSGFLVCWAGRSAGVSRRVGECFTVDGMFRRIGGTDAPDFGAVGSAGRAGDLIGARTGNTDGGDDLLFALDDDGNAVSEPVTWPCERARAYAWVPSGLACLLASDPLCGTQFDEPPDCMNDLHVYDLSGEESLLVPAVAPYGAYNEWIDVQVAGRTDGYLVSWVDAGGWHAQAVDTAGGLGQRVDYPVPYLAPSALFANDTGYVGLWQELNDGYQLPRLLRLAPDGTAGTPEWVTEPGGALTRQYAFSAAVAGTGDGLAVAWSGAGGVDASDHVAALRLRSMGCSAP